MYDFCSCDNIIAPMINANVKRNPNPKPNPNVNHYPIPRTKNPIVTLTLTLCCRRHHRMSNCRQSKCRIIENTEGPHK